MERPLIVTANGKTFEATTSVNGEAPEGVALLRGVPFVAGTAVIESIEKR